MLSGNNHIYFQIHDYCSPLRECYLVVDDRQDQIPGESHVLSRLVSKTLNTVCAYLIALQDMAHRGDFPDPDGARTTNLNVDIVVYMAWSDLRDSSIFGEQ